MSAALTAMPRLGKLHGRRLWRLHSVPEKPHKSLQNQESEERKWALLHTRSVQLSCRDWNAYLKVPKHGNKLQFAPHGRFWWCVNFHGSICSFQRGRGRPKTQQLFRAHSAEGRGKRMFAGIFSAFLQKFFQEAVLAALLGAWLGSSLPAACWVCT